MKRCQPICEELTRQQAVDAGQHTVAPFMLAQTRETDLELVSCAGPQRTGPGQPGDVPFHILVRLVIQLKTAFR